MKNKNKNKIIEVKPKNVCSYSGLPSTLSYVNEDKANETSKTK